MAGMEAEMDESRTDGGYGIQVGCYEQDGEKRRVFVERGAMGQLRIREVSEGVLTRALFGGGTRFHEVRVDADEAVRLGWELGTSDVPEDLVAALMGFFGSSGRFLSDLMDVMDARDIAYGYLSCVPDEGVWYRAARATVG